MINNQRVPYFDVLNIIACIAVIALHHNGIVHWYDVHSVIWIQALVFEVFFLWAVPIFFIELNIPPMISLKRGLLEH